MNKEKINLDSIFLKTTNENLKKRIVGVKKVKDAAKYISELELSIYKLQSQLTEANEKLEKIEKYITSYESISLIQGLDDINKNKRLDKKTMTEMTNRYLDVHDTILEIIKGSDNK